MAIRGQVNREYTVGCKISPRINAAFVECLDYVFCSPGQWAVRGVKPLPSKATMDITKPFPTKAEPSDHVLIAADLEVV